MLIGFSGNSWLRFVVVSVTVVTAGACGTDGDAAPARAASDLDGGGTGNEEATLRLGYLPNVTHATAIIGVETGLFEELLGAGVALEVETFNSGTEVVEALFSEGIDASFVGPNPAINGFARSDGKALRIVAGTTSGGAAFVVRDGITSPDDLVGTTVATPALGNTQDVALRAWLKGQGLSTDASGGGDVSITPQENSDTLAAFRSGALDGAWVPEPWATRLVEEGGGTVLVDEAELWPGGRFVTTHLIVATPFLEAHPDVVRDLIAGLGDAIDQANADATAAQATTNDGIEKVTTSRLTDETIRGAWERLEFTLDPITTSLRGSANHAIEVGLLEPLALDDIYDLTLLNDVLVERGDALVSGL